MASSKLIMRDPLVRLKFGPCVVLLHFFFVTDMIGCYIDDKTLDDNFRLVNPRALGYQVERFDSKQDCIDQCGDKGFLYAGFQNGDLCFCGNDYDKYGRADDSECNIKCRTPDKPVEFTDKEFESCGGRWRNAVYAGKYFICKTERYILVAKGWVALSRITFSGQGVFTNHSTNARWI